MRKDTKNEKLHKKKETLRRKDTTFSKQNRQ